MSPTSSTARARPSPPVGRLASFEVLIVGGALAGTVLLAWAWLLSQAGAMSMHPGPWSADYLVPAFTMWALMMVAMMLPSAAPMILLHARIDRGSARERLLHSAIFVGAYVLVWGAFSLAAALAQAALVATDVLRAMDLALGSRLAAAALLVAAAGYQLTAAKRACLDQCRSPIHFVMRHWSPGPAGALRLGVAHGLYCLGCCWALMLLLFAGGVMNLAWIAALALVVFAEKLAPRAWHASAALALGLFAAAAALVVAS